MIGITEGTSLGRRAMSDRRGAALAYRVRHKRLTYLEVGAILDLRDRAIEADRTGREGAILEAGCALGGSAIVLAASKSPRRPLFVYDVFGMIPPPGEHDGADVIDRYREIAAGHSEGIDGDPYYGYNPDLVETVRRNFAAFGLDPAADRIALVQGLFIDTVHPDGPVALAHIDGDWYDSVAICLERIWPALVPGGVIVIDDYDDWSGCRTAVDEFLAATPDATTERRSRLHLVKA